MVAIFSFPFALPIASAAPSCSRKCRSSNRSIRLVLLIRRRGTSDAPVFSSRCRSRCCQCHCIAGTRTQLVEREYAQLNLKETPPHLGHVRIRQHVNPLKSSLSIPAPAPEWNEVFQDPTLPLMVDVGCGGGRFLIWLAKKFPDSNNYLGLEIRKKLVKRAEFWVKDLALRNIFFMFANATISFEQVVTTYPGPLMLVSILCPDPYFKKRHHKRRVLQKPLMDSISKNLSPGGKVFVQSDVFEVAMEMRNQFDALSDVFEHVDVVDTTKVWCDLEGWVLRNPMGARTEREIHVEFEGAKMYRRLYRKRAHMAC